jgi:hypothetical protein
MRDKVTGFFSILFFSCVHKKVRVSTVTMDATRVLILTKEVVKKVNERFRQKGDQLVRKMTKELVKNDFEIEAIQEKKVQSLNENQKSARVQKCQQLFAWHADDDIILSNEKLFLLQEAHNQHNERVFLFC